MSIKVTPVKMPGGWEVEFFLDGQNVQTDPAIDDVVVYLNRKQMLQLGIELIKGAAICERLNHEEAEKAGWRVEYLSLKSKTKALPEQGRKGS